STATRRARRSARRRCRETGGGNRLGEPVRGERGAPPPHRTGAAILVFRDTTVLPTAPSPGRTVRLERAWRPAPLARPFGPAARRSGRFPPRSARFLPSRRTGGLPFRCFSSAPLFAAFAN